MLKLMIASNNRGKIREFQSLLTMPELELVTPASIGLELEAAETGSSYAENAAIKARAFWEACGLLTLADDSGLEVDALDGAPGLHSARFVQRAGANDADRREKLLDALQGKTRPWRARFRCVAALVGLAGEINWAEGICEGEIIPIQRGDNGFGYDPIFLLPEIGKTMAELSLDEKNHLSHRARAAQAAIPLIEKYLSKI